MRHCLASVTVARRQAPGAVLGSSCTEQYTLRQVLSDTRFCVVSFKIATFGLATGRDGRVGDAVRFWSELVPFPPPATVSRPFGAVGMSALLADIMRPQVVVACGTVTLFRCDVPPCRTDLGIPGLRSAHDVVGGVIIVWTVHRHPCSRARAP